MHHSGATGRGFLVAKFVGELIRQAVRLRGNRLWQTGLLQQHRHGVGFGTTVRGGDRRAADGLRQDLFGKIEERLVVLFGGGDGVFAFIRGTGQQSRQFW
ncbi:hypothetical protein D3C86_1808640 [compost metagenome]